MKNIEILNVKVKYSILHSIKISHIILIILLSFNSYSQDYKVRDDGVDSVSINFLGNIVKGSYKGQYIKKLNGEKGFYPHGKGILTISKSDRTDSYIGDFFEGKISGNGRFNAYPIFYEGSVSDGMANGEGILYYEKRERDGIKSINGFFKNGKANGKVVIEYYSYNVYTGDVVDGKLNGQGKMVCIDESLNKPGTQLSYYIGGWKENLRDSFGIAFYKNGEKLEGMWKNNLFNGKGKLTLWNDQIYDGEWKDGTPDGKGILRSKNGSFYNGNFKQGIFTGYGKVYYDSGNQYEGLFVNDLSEGQGTFTFKNGETWVGIFFHDKFTTGIKTRLDGTFENGTWNEKGNFKGIAKRISGNNGIWEGKWEGQIPVDSGKIIHPSGNIYIGEWMGELNSTNNYYYWYMHGKGKLAFVNGDVYVGSFNHDSYSGYGIMKYQNGDVYTGNWLEGKKNGQGTMTFKNKSVFTGEWKNDNMNGEGVLVLANKTIQKGKFVDGVYSVPFSGPTVRIGSQDWMTTNLNVDHFRNGDIIFQAKNFEEWQKAAWNKTPAWCYYEFNVANGTKYGKLYNWYAASDVRGLAPMGCHVPSQNEFETLVRVYGQSPGSIDWRTPAEAALKSKLGWEKNPGTNTSGFNAIPSGYMHYSSYAESWSWMKSGESAYFWSTTCCIDYDSSASAFRLGYYICSMQTNESKNIGYSVRCIKDN